MKLCKSFLVAVAFSTLVGQAQTRPPLPHIVTVAATSDPVLNGANLVNTVAAINGLYGNLASSSQPWVVHLDAGVYSVGSSVTVLPWVSIRGAGMFSTYITTQCPTWCPKYGTVSIQQYVVANCYVCIQSNAQSISDLTISAGTAAPALHAEVGGQLLIDHVQLVQSGISLANPSGTGLGAEFLMTSSAAQFFVTNSVLHTITTSAATSPGPGGLHWHVGIDALSSIASSEIDSPVIPWGVPFVCVADYNATAKVLGNTCQ